MAPYSQNSTLLFEESPTFGPCLSLCFTLSVSLFYPVRLCFTLSVSVLPCLSLCFTMSVSVFSVFYPGTSKVTPTKRFLLQFLPLFILFSYALYKERLGGLGWETILQLDRRWTSEPSSALRVGDWTFWMIHCNSEWGSECNLTEMHCVLRPQNFAGSSFQCVNILKCSVQWHTARASGILQEQSLSRASFVVVLYK